VGISSLSTLRNNLPPVDVAICRPSVGGKIEWWDFAFRLGSLRRSSGLIIGALILALEVIYIVEIRKTLPSGTAPAAPDLPSRMKIS
jgi:hypothetical protein